MATSPVDDAAGSSAGATTAPYPASAPSWPDPTPSGPSPVPLPMNNGPSDEEPDSEDAACEAYFQCIDDDPPETCAMLAVECPEGPIEVCLDMFYICAETEAIEGCTTELGTCAAEIPSPDVENCLWQHVQCLLLPEAILTCEERTEACFED